MVIDTTRLLFRFIISALSATASIFPTERRSESQLNHGLRLCRTVACGFAGLLPAGFAGLLPAGFAGLLPAALPDCCLRACWTVACGFAGPRSLRRAQRPVEVLVTMVMLWSTKAPLRASWVP